MAYYAHSKNKADRWHPLAEHLRGVAELAGEFAEASGFAEEAELAGLLHDLGKYGDRFQKRLVGEDHGLDHWSMGAWLALSEYGAIAAALAIQGHHIGLQALHADELKRLQPEKLKSSLPPQLSLSETNLNILKARLGNDGLVPRKPSKTICGLSAERTIGRMLDIRLLFSALVDADFLDTEAHFNGNPRGKVYREPGPALQATEALARVLAETGRLAATTTAPENVAQVRQSLLAACIAAGAAQPGLFTLTAPTGSGKTLAMLAFALAHAQKHGLRRIVMVIPYLSIIEQTARIYRAIFEPRFGADYVLEHHSLAGRGAEDSQSDSEGDIESAAAAERRRRLLAENWDAPLIVTTSVQALESLFSNRPSACRKLHRLSRSIILFDEAQTLPPGLAVPTLAALSRLAQAHGASVVFSTATQPAFEHLHGEALKHGPQGWQPRPIVPEPAQLFAPLRRVRVDWPKPDQTLAWPELAEHLRKSPQALCIVNLKRHAAALWEEIAGEAVFHLSTNQCAAHRRDALDTVRTRLEDELPVHLVATQCIEAGVDVDFPEVWRAHGPLETIIQAAGRCNREGKRSLGHTHVFMPEAPAGERLYPTEAYAQAAAVTQSLLLKHGPEGMRLDDPEFIAAYYRELYAIGKPENSKKTRQIEEYVKAGAFPEIAREYRLIDQDTINIVVPYSPCQTLFQELRDMADDEGLTTAWIKQARPLAIGLFRPKSQDDPIWDSLLPVQSKRQRGKKQAEDWYIDPNPGHYHSALGYQPPKGLNLYIG